mgnify:CR=1 FL=1
MFGKVDVVYVDIAQPDQTKIAIDNCDMFLKKDGFFFLVIKTRSIDVTKAPKKIVAEEIEKLREKFEILESIAYVSYTHMTLPTINNVYISDDAISRKK